MMTRTTLLAIVVLGVAIAAAGVAHLARAEEAAPAALAEPGEDEVTTTLGAPAADPNPVVAVVVGHSVTDYEQDPFEPGRMRSSQTRVKTLLFVRADGTLETKQVP